MKHRIFLAGAFIFTAFSLLSAQRWAVHLNLNEYYPLFAEEKGYYPMLWYSGTEGRGLLLGGFGGGVSWTRPLKGGWSLKAQADLRRSRYYDEPVLFVDEAGQSLGAYIGVTTNLNLNAFCVPAYQMGKRWRIGIGLGLQSTLLSTSDYGEIISFGEKKKLAFTNQSIQPFVVTLPLEITYLFGRFSLSYRVEAGLTKVSRLPYVSGERFVNGVIELGYLIGNESVTLKSPENK